MVIDGAKKKPKSPITLEMELAQKVRVRVRVRVKKDAFHSTLPPTHLAATSLTSHLATPPHSTSLHPTPSPPPSHH